MEITAEFLRSEIAAMEQRRAQQIADLNVTEGALQVLGQLLARAESTPDVEPERLHSVVDPRQVESPA